jgi:hypothetical protein
LGVDAGLEVAIGQESFEEDGVDAAVDAHQEYEHGKGETLAQDGGEHFAVEAPAEWAAVVKHGPQGDTDGEGVGSALDPHEGPNADGAVADKSEQEGSAAENHQQPVKDGEHRIEPEELQAADVGPQEEDEGEHELIETEHSEHQELGGVVAEEQAGSEADDRIADGQKETKADDAREVFAQEV